jgi:hypothetical protein
MKGSAGCRLLSPASQPMACLPGPSPVHICCPLSQRLRTPYICTSLHRRLPQTLLYKRENKVTQHGQGLTLEIGTTPRRSCWQHWFACRNLGEVGPRGFHGQASPREAQQKAEARAERACGHTAGPEPVKRQNTCVRPFILCPVKKRSKISQGSNRASITQGPSQCTKRCHQQNPG